MLRELVEKKRTLFLKSADSWQDSIRLSCKPLEQDGTVDAGYADEIIRCVEEHGPYIVLIPGFAMPHSQENSATANKTGIGFMKLEQAVIFDEDDPDKYATVFFTLAATDPSEHMTNMRTLFKMLTNDDLVEDLQTVQSDDDLILLADKYGLD